MRFVSFPLPGFGNEFRHGKRNERKRKETKGNENETVNRSQARPCRCEHNQGTAEAPNRARRPQPGHSTAKIQGDAHKSARKTAAESGHIPGFRCRCPTRRFVAFAGAKTIQGSPECVAGCLRFQERIANSFLTAYTFA